MTTLFSCLVVAFMFWKLGRKYSDFQDIMLARRVAKLVSQREQISKDQVDYERAVEIDRKIARREKRKFDALGDENL